jgi:hypothetical protein
MQLVVVCGGLFFFVCLMSWGFSLYDEQAVAARRKDDLRAHRQSLRVVQPPRSPSNPPPQLEVGQPPQLEVVQSQPQSQTQTQSKRDTPVPLGTWNKVLKLVHYDLATADRLIQGIRLRYPDKSTKWVVEKVLWDLERDKLV